jgi:hypothetical protein
VDVHRAKVRVQAQANRQAGRISRAQLTQLGVRRGRIEGWIEEGYLVRGLPEVYAVGHVAPSVMGDLFAAVLYAGPGAMLSHMTAAWWRGLIEYARPRISVRTPRRRLSRSGIQVHGRSSTERHWHKQLPVTSLGQTMLDLAASAELKLVRKALGRLDYQYDLDTEALARICGRGRPGSAALKWAIANYDPRFGRTNSPLEDNWLCFCERFDVPKPDDVNAWVHGIQVDALYAEQRLVVELDGGANHHSAAQMRRDHRNDLILRGHGLRVNRYSRDLVHDEPLAVRADVLATLASSSSSQAGPRGPRSRPSRARR